jgi:MoxR-like ATPase
MGKMDARSVGIIGLEAEFELMVQALNKGIPVILEGEAGTGKTEMGKAAARILGRQLYRVDGDQELSTLKMQGWFDPPLVLQKGYSWESFMPGPLSQAMMQGGIFFFNEINRAPSETINGVLTALDERQTIIPRLGVIKAEDGFISIFTSNPLDRIGTNPLPQAFFDRCIWIGINHLPLEEAMEIVHLRTGENDENMTKIICKVVELSRAHPEVVSGGSIRAAIFMVKLAQAYRQKGINPCERDTLIIMAKSALWKKIKLKYDSELNEKEVVEDVVEKVLGLKSSLRKKKKLA